jgi:hypothetical protein
MRYLSKALKLSLIIVTYTSCDSSFSGNNKKSFRQGAAETEADSNSTGGADNNIFGEGGSSVDGGTGGVFGSGASGGGSGTSGQGGGTVGGGDTAGGTSVGGSTTGGGDGSGGAFGSPWPDFMKKAPAPSDCQSRTVQLVFNFVANHANEREFEKSFDMTELAKQYPKMRYISVGLDGVKTSQGFWPVRLLAFNKQYETTASRPGDDLIVHISLTTLEAFTSHPNSPVRFAQDSITLPNQFTLRAFIPPTGQVTVQNPMAYLVYCL